MLLLILVDSMLHVILLLATINLLNVTFLHAGSFLNELFISFSKQLKFIRHECNTDWYAYVAFAFEGRISI